MNGLKKFLYRTFLPRLIQRTCPNLIPRSGERGQAINCFVAAWDREDGAPYLLARQFDGETIGGDLWDGDSYSQDSECLLEEIDVFHHFRMEHYWGLNTIYFNSIYDVAFHRITGLAYLRVWARRFFSALGSFFYKRSKLHSKNKIELLKFVLDFHLKDGRRNFHPRFLMSLIHTPRWNDHPDSENELRKLELYLDALASDGAFSTNQLGDYILEGPAIGIIEVYEEEERRHADAVSLNRWLVFLTLVIAVSGLIATNIVKIPTFFDFTS